MKTKLLFPMTGLLLICGCQSHDMEYDASGIFETTEVIVSAESTGRLLSLHTEEGQTVTAGDTLGLIDTLQLSLKKEQLRASVSATDSKKLDENKQVAALRKQINNLQKEKKRFGELLAAHAATAKQVDDIDYQIEELEKRLEAAEEQVGSNNHSLSQQSKGIKAQIEQVEDQINKSIITTPLSGTILTQYAEEGEYAVPGRALFKVADMKKMRLRAYVTADLLTRLKIGMKVKVYADMGTKERKEYAGTVTWIADKAEFTPKTIQTRDERANLVYAVKVDVVNDGLIKRGMYGELKL